MEITNQKIMKDFDGDYSLLSPYYKKAIKYFLLIKNELNLWLSYYGKIVFLNQPFIKSRKLRYDYGDIILMQEEKEPQEALYFIKDLFNNKPIELDGKSITFQSSPALSHFTPSFMSDGVFQLEWPHTDYEFNLNYKQNINKPPQKLVAKDALFFPDIDHAIHNFFNSANLRFESNPKIRIILPDYRGRIKEMNLKEDGVEFKNETNLSTFKDHSLKFYYSTKHGPEYSNANYVINDDGSVHIKTKEYPWEIEAVLTLNGQIIDSLQYYPQSYWGRTKGIIEENSVKRIEDAINEGENLRTEFKLRLGKDESTSQSKNEKQKQVKDQRRDEFLESVVAFANAEGGTIYLGVSDQGQIIGLEDPEDDQQRIIEYVDKFSKPPIKVSSKIFEINGKNILIISVPPGIEKPYFLMTANLDEFAYIRRGSTDRKIKSIELQDLFLKKFQSNFSSNNGKF